MRYLKVEDDPLFDDGFSRLRVDEYLDEGDIVLLCLADGTMQVYAVTQDDKGLFAVHRVQSLPLFQLDEREELVHF